MSDESPRERQIRLASMTGTERIAAERQRQVDEEGWSVEHDHLEHFNGELADAAKCYIEAARMTSLGSEADVDELMESVGIGPWAITHLTNTMPWPWEAKWWKPSRDPLVNYAKAGALIAAEIDRLRSR